MQKTVKDCKTYKMNQNPKETASGCKRMQKDAKGCKRLQKAALDAKGCKRL